MLNAPLLKSERLRRLSKEGFWIVLGQAMVVLASLVGVRILSHDRTRVVVSADEVNLGLSLWSLLHGSLPRPNRIVLVGPQVEVHRDAEGVFTIAGLEGTPQHAPTDWRASLREVFSQ